MCRSKVGLSVEFGRRTRTIHDGNINTSPDTIPTTTIKTGESGLDVYSRVTSFLATLYADFADESIKVRAWAAAVRWCWWLMLSGPCCACAVGDRPTTRWTCTHTPTPKTPSTPTPQTKQDPELNVVIVTHGLTLRLLVMRWFQYSISDFEESINPPNGGVVRGCVWVYCWYMDVCVRRRMVCRSEESKRATTQHP